MPSLFVYGSLTDQAQVLAITGRIFPRKPAVLTGFRRIESPGHYPYILPAIDEEVAGFVLLGVDPISLRKLDRYEGAFYRRIRVAVRCRCGPMPAWTYVGDPSGEAPRRE